jgi:hypothetical protein
MRRQVGEGAQCELCAAGDVTRLLSFVMPGLVPGTHVLLWATKTWMAGINPAMTAEGEYLTLNWR